MPNYIQTLCLFILTALAEIGGCYLGYLILKQHKTAWLWLPTGFILLLFVWLLTLHPTATGRMYAMYGGVYICVALAWLRFFEHVPLTVWDIVGGVIVLIGASVIILQPNLNP